MFIVGACVVMVVGAAVVVKAVVVGVITAEKIIFV